MKVVEVLVSQLAEKKRRLVEALRQIREELKPFALDLGPALSRGDYCPVCDEVDSEDPCLHVVVCATYEMARSLLEEMDR